VAIPIPHNAPWVTEADYEAIARVLASGQIAQGPEVENLEMEFSAMLGGGSACAVSSGTAALFLALRGLGIGASDIVALPTYSCSALLNAVNMLGASSRLVDIRDDDLNIDVDLVPIQAKEAQTVIAVHCFGAQADVTTLVQQGLSVVEDCCQSLGGPQGRQGAVSVYSFYATKIISGGQGGLVWDGSGKVAEIARDYRQFDCREEYIPRFNFQMTDIQAAMVRSQLSRLGAIKQKRQRIYETLRGCVPQGWTHQAGLSNSDNLPYRFVVRAPDSTSRDSLGNYMSENAISCAVPIEKYELLHRYLGLNPADFPVAELVAETSLSIPLFPAMSAEDEQYVARVLGGFR